MKWVVHMSADVLIWLTGEWHHLIKNFNYCSHGWIFLMLTDFERTQTQDASVEDLLVHLIFAVLYGHDIAFYIGTQHATERKSLQSLHMKHNSKKTGTRGCLCARFPIYFLNQTARRSAMNDRASSLTACKCQEQSSCQSPLVTV